MQSSGSQLPLLQKKVVLLGATAVGKTSIFNRVINTDYIEDNVTTMAAYFRPKTVEFPEKNCRLKINLWDTAGQERFQSLTKQYIQGSQGILLVYDLTDLDSLKQAEEWFSQVQDQANLSEITIALIGNKVDDLDRQEIAKKDADALAKRVGAKFHMQVSAKTNDNIEKMFREMGLQLIAADSEFMARGQTLTPKDKKKKKSSRCSI